MLDRTIPFMQHRWAATAILFFIFWWRILALQGFYVVAYTVSIYQLNILLLFLTPKFLPEDFPSGFASGDDGSLLPSTSPNPASQTSQTSGGGSEGDDEFRPFIRRLPEFQFWWQMTSSLGYALGATLFSVFDIPVFWPILLLYFIALFAFTMRRQIEHMIEHHYIPFDFGKKRFGSGAAGIASDSRRRL